MSKSIPDRWMEYKPYGRTIDGTRIVCFKVPLHARVQTGKPEIKEIWDLPALRQAIPNLGAVIDLTNTARYYNPNELTAQGVLHKKILMPGRVIPPESKVKEFMDAVDEFLGKNSDLLVGVHCTHGLNRTGYMVCRYMRDRLQIPATVAIKKFEKARGYQIERENYVADILGKKPPPPDPFDHHNKKKSHENGDRHGYQRRQNSREEDRSRNESRNWRDECKYPSYKGSEGNRPRKESSSRSDRERSDTDSYDFKYDY